VFNTELKSVNKSKAEIHEPYGMIDTVDGKGVLVGYMIEE